VLAEWRWLKTIKNKNTTKLLEVGENDFPRLIPCANEFQISLQM